MMKPILQLLFTGLLALAAITHLLRLIKLLFNPGFLRRIGWIKEQPSKKELALYYILVFGTCSYMVWQRMGGL